MATSTAEQLIDFYENYFTINGEKPPPLTQFQRNLIAMYGNLKEGEKVWILRGRRTDVLATVAVAAIQECEKRIQ